MSSRSSPASGSISDCTPVFSVLFPKWGKEGNGFLRSVMGLVSSHLQAMSQPRKLVLTEPWCGMRAGVMEVQQTP